MGRWRSNIRIVGGLLLILTGILFMLGNYGILENAMTILWAILFSGGGLLFLYMFWMNREQWWPLLPGFTLLGVGILLAMEELYPTLADAVGGGIILTGISLAFFLVYFSNREHWWAVIPGGVLLTSAVMASLPNSLEDAAVGIFFLGLGVTFALLTYLPSPRERMKWPLIPAGVFLLMGVIFMAFSDSVFQYIWPAALILGGILVIARTFLKKS